MLLLKHCLIVIVYETKAMQARIPSSLLQCMRLSYARWIKWLFPMLQVLFQNDSPATLLARVIGIIGPIDQGMLAKGRDTYKYFTKNHMLYERNQVCLFVFFIFLYFFYYLLFDYLKNCISFTHDYLALVIFFVHICTASSSSFTKFWWKL